MIAPLSMRYLAVVTAILLGFTAGEAAPSKKESRATQAYNQRMSDIASRAIDSELSKHSERLSGVSMKLRYTVDQSGHVRDVEIVSDKPDRWAEKTAARVLKAVRFPRIPETVLQELGMDHIKAEAELSYQITRKPPPGEDVNSAYYKYNMRVHKMLQDKVEPSFRGQPARLEVDYEFYLDPQGRVTSLKTHAKAGGKWAEQTIAKSIRSLKCPAIPPQVFKELEQKPPLKIYGTMTWDPYGGR